jgi:hypothetical protein
MVSATRDKLQTILATTEVIVSVGGDATGPSKETTAYDPVSQECTSKCPMLRRRAYCATTIRSGKMVAAGYITVISLEDCNVEECTTLWTTGGVGLFAYNLIAGNWL